MGYSTGKWEGDTLAVDTAGFNDKGWMDDNGHPRSEALRVQERFHRRDFGHLDVQAIIDDPKVLTRPVTIKFTELHKIVKLSRERLVLAQRPRRDMRRFSIAQENLDGVNDVMRLGCVSCVGSGGA